mgnify:CR=1 FL=1|tara:strand:+ start:1724 stop:2005 length:282 start_codon:yes stop_codon:yes gene_type:complete
MHDAAWFERGGTPACAILSSGFKPQARYQARIIGAECVPHLFVPHPISDQSAAQLVVKADGVFEEAFAAITKPWTPPPEAKLGVDGALPVCSD